MILTAVSRALDGTVDGLYAEEHDVQRSLGESSTPLGAE
jgi:hypothetical protein